MLGCAQVNTSHCKVVSGCLWREDAKECVTVEDVGQSDLDGLGFRVLVLKLQRFNSQNPVSCAQPFYRSCLRPSILTRSNISA